MGQLAETSLGTRYDRIFQLIQKRVSEKLELPIEIQLWGNRVYRLGKGDPAVKILVEDRQGLAALLKLDEVKICEAYMAGSLDVKGDMLGFASLRGLLSDHHPLHSLWQRIAPLFIGRIRTDREAIAGHYDFSNDFYLKFMDPTRCYSQAVFEKDDESLETAQRRKLGFAIDACRLKPGDRVLDVGGGWGSFTEHAGRQGIQVTSLTISQQSKIFLTDLIAQLQLPCRVLNQPLQNTKRPQSSDRGRFRLCAIFQKRKWPSRLFTRWPFKFGAGRRPYPFFGQLAGRQPPSFATKRLHRCSQRCQRQKEGERMVG